MRLCLFCLGVFSATSAWAQPPGYSTPTPDAPTATADPGFPFASQTPASPPPGAGTTTAPGVSTDIAPAAPPPMPPAPSESDTFRPPPPVDMDDATSTDTMPPPFRGESNLPPPSAPFDPREVPGSYQPVPGDDFEYPDDRANNFWGPSMSTAREMDYYGNNWSSPSGGSEGFRPQPGNAPSGRLNLDNLNQFIEPSPKGGDAAAPKASKGGSKK